MHRQPHPLVGADDEQGAHRLRQLHVVLVLLVQHAEPDRQIAARVGYDRVREVADNIRTV